MKNKGHSYQSVSDKDLSAYNKIRKRNKRKRLCHAPFKSLFFSQYGEIFACFYNKRELLGKYPESDIDAVWNGEKLRTLREHIRHNDLNFGCGDCLGHIQKGNYYSAGAWKYDYLPEGKGDFPVSLDFQISNHCNLQCIMCSGENSDMVRLRRENETPYRNPYDSEFVTQLRRFIPGLKEAAFTGGEPFLIPVYFEIWDMIAGQKPNVRISVTTNGTILNDKVKNILERLDFNITLSIDSLNKQNFESIRVNADFDEVMKNLEFFHRYTQKKKTVLNVKACPMRQNWKYLPDLFDFLNGKNIPVIYNNVVYPPHCSLWNLDPGSLKSISEYLNQYDFKWETALQKDNVDRYRNLIRQVRNWHKAALDREKEIADGHTDEIRLMGLFVRQIREYLLNDTSLNDEEKARYTEHFLELAGKMFSEVPEGNDMIKALSYFIHMPVDRVVGEMQFRDIEKLRERVRQAYMPFNANPENLYE